MIGDVHLSDTAPSIRTSDYSQQILNKLKFCVDYANANADVIVQLGDLWHLKGPSKTSHRLVQATAAVLEQFKGRVLIVPGNHDMSQDRLDSLPSQPLGTLALSPNIELLSGWDSETGIFGIPYLHSFEKFREQVEKVSASREYVGLIATHASIFPDGEHPPYEHMNPENIGDTGGIPIAYGHIHDPHGFYLASTGTWYCNNGAISRGSLHEKTVNREPAITLFDDTMKGNPFVSIPVPFLPPEQVFRLAEHVEKEDKKQQLDDFLTSVGDINLTKLSVEQVLAEAAEKGLSSSARLELEQIIQLVTNN